MPTRTITGTLDTFSVDAGSEVTYEGPSSAGDKGLNIRAFKVNPGSTGDIIVKLDRSTGVNKGKGGCAVTVTDATKDYIVLLNLDGYSEVSYGGTVEVP